jgi:large subunit ribosomal protein L24
MPSLKSKLSQKSTARYNLTTCAPTTAILSVNMQKVIRRTQLAEKQAARRLAKRKDKEGRTWRKTNREQTNFYKKESSTALKTARLNRREDWELGPLAPKRDVGDKKDTYGTVSTQMMRGPILEQHNRKKAREAIGGEFMNIVKGDRVVLLEGRDKGKIGTISNVDTDRCEFTVEGLNMVRSWKGVPQGLANATGVDGCSSTWMDASGR